MIFSRAKLEDMKQREHYLAETERALRDGLKVTARAMGQASKFFGDRLKTHDYGKDKTFEEIWGKMVEEGKARAKLNQ